MIIRTKLFSVARLICRYSIREFDLMFNLVLIFWSLLDTPPLFAFAFDLLLIWLHVMVEVYKDKLHIDDFTYDSRTLVQLSIATALHASLGFVIKTKVESGAIDANWWRFSV
ncbi:unnamed protein product [Ambrosiozyma monospora]|uniref:Unnamed protein product n=1 Tax=Ambrosiozyma monospora TaxID=43982 RepID=A0ACB5UBY8_AMBMO|nr:unnamed protein product [Ambrosiozyma monospora]